jgi:hypothetical protein
LRPDRDAGSGTRILGGLTVPDPQALVMMTKSVPDRRSGYKGLSVTIMTIPRYMLFFMARWNASSALSLDTTDSSDPLPPETVAPALS